VNSMRRSGFLAIVITFSLFTAAAASAQENKAEHHHYKLIEVGTLGRPNSSNAWAGIGNKTMNAGNAVIGQAATPAPDSYCFVDCFLNFAFHWNNGGLSEQSSCLCDDPVRRESSRGGGLRLWPHGRGRAKRNPSQSF